MNEKLFPGTLNIYLNFCDFFFSVDNGVNHLKIALGQNRILLKCLDDK